MRLCLEKILKGSHPYPHKQQLATSSNILANDGSKATQSHATIIGSYVMIQVHAQYIITVKCASGFSHLWQTGTHK
jgi:hypothetical protein